jgi:hypothetical protein
MVDPNNLTNFHLSDGQLEEYILFGIAVAGKPAIRTAHILDLFLEGSDRPFDLIRPIELPELARRLQRLGFGCYTLRAKGFNAAAHSGLDLRACTAAQLEALPGVGPKTSRLFLLHTRPDVRAACLDTHLLKWLRALGHPAPASTPGTPRAYRLWEDVYLKEADRLGRDPAELDLEVWKSYARRGDNAKGRAG